MTNVTPFDFNGTQIRVITDEAGNPWFVAKDVAIELGHSNPSQAVATHVDEDDKGLQILDTLRGPQRLIVVNESGLYALIFGSTLPAARAFKRWVTSEVLPVIRRTGAYASVPIQPQDELDMVEIAIRNIREQRARLENVEQRQNAIEAKVAAVAGEHDWFTALAYAKLNNLPTDRTSCQRHGQRASARMREWSQEPIKRQDATFGLINTYPLHVLQETAQP